MEQHAVPQNVSSYQFRLIGDMTVKQFAELAAGILLAWLIVSSQLYFFVKWPLGISSAFMGFALAFLPVEERPLDIWIKNFVLSIYKPTLFIWRKKPITLKEIHHRLKNQPTTPDVSPAASQQKLSVYLDTIKNPVTPSALDDATARHMQQIQKLLYENSGHFQEPMPMTAKDALRPTTNNQPVTASGIRVRQLGPHETIRQAMPIPTPKIKLPPYPDDDKPSKAATKPGWTSSDNKNSSTSAPLPGPKPAPLIITQAPPLAPPLKVESLFPEKRRVRAPFNPGLQLPMVPDRPNLLVGMVASPYQKPAIGAILEIKTAQNDTVLVSKSNRLGQFFTATPLVNGSYQLHVDHPDWDFDIINLEAKGEVIPPLQIIGRGKAPA